MDPRIRAGIFAGESGGDYDALLGFSNRPGGAFSNVRLTDMTVDDAINFARGPYASYSRGKLGRVATPMGAYQIVGSTLAAAKKALGLSGSERMTPELQDRLGEHILQTQGTGAWMGYRGPRDATSSTARYDPRSDTPSTGHPTGSTLPGPGPDSTVTINPYVPPSQYNLPAAPDYSEYLKALARKDTKSPAEVMGAAIANMGVSPEKVGMGQAPALPQTAPTMLPAMPMVDPQQAEMRRQMLAQAMARLNQGTLV
jgi:hypothetical protein